MGRQALLNDEADLKEKHFRVGLLFLGLKHPAFLPPGLIHRTFPQGPNLIVGQFDPDQPKTLRKVGLHRIIRILKDLAPSGLSVFAPFQSRCR